MRTRQNGGTPRGSPSSRAPFAGLVVMLLLGGCGGSVAEGDGTLGDSSFGRCAPRGSAIGDAVASAAERGGSTVSWGNIDTLNNQLVDGPIVDGEQLGNEMYNLIRSAQREVFIQSLQIQEDTWLGRRMRDAIWALPGGVRVYILFYTDSVHSLIPGGWPGGDWRRDVVTRMKAFLGVSPGHHTNVTVAAWNATNIAGSNLIHSKTIVVDGVRAMVTTTNTDRDGDPAFAGGLGWFQLGMVLDGSVVRGLRQDAASAWAHADPGATLPAAPLGEGGGQCNRMIIASREAGSGEDSSGDLAISALFRAANHELRVISPNLNDDGALAALAQAAQRVQVKMILSKGFNNTSEEIPGQGGTNADNIVRLRNLIGAQHQSNLRVCWYTTPGGTVPDGNGAGASHVKFASADGQTMILGSQNLDTQSWKHSREIGVVIDEPGPTSAFDWLFDDIWRRAASNPAANALSCR